MTDVVLTTSAFSSWKDAERACLNYICDSVGYEYGKNAFIGDILSDNKANIFAFNISGGPEQIQNFQCPRPSKRFLTDAALIAQFIDRDMALDFAGRLLDNFPAYGDPERSTGRTGSDQVVLEPNVCLFELLTFPTLESLIVELVKGKENKLVHMFVLYCQFRVVFNNQKLSETN